MRERQVTQIVDQIVTIPNDVNSCTFMMHEMCIDSNRRHNEVNVVSFWETTDHRGQTVPTHHVLNNAAGCKNVKFSIQIADRPLSKSDKGHRPDYHKPHKEAMGHMVEIRRKRVYVRFLGEGGIPEGCQVHIRMIVKVEPKRHQKGYEHVTKPDTLLLDSIKPGQTRILAR